MFWFLILSDFLGLTTKPSVCSPSGNPGLLATVAGHESGYLTGGGDCYEQIPHFVGQQHVWYNMMEQKAHESFFIVREYKTIQEILYK